MHPTGFDTRTGVTDDLSVFLAALTNPDTCPQPSSNISATRFRDILDANAFREKLQFIEDVMTSWVRNGRLGGRISSVLSRYASRTNSSSSISTVSASMTTPSLRSASGGSLASLSVSTAPTSTSIASAASFAPTRSESQVVDAELFWEGMQEKTWEEAAGGKFVWVSVGAQGGDGEYVSVMLKGGEVHCGGEVEADEGLKVKLRAMMGR